MHAPKWKLFSVLWAVTAALWTLPYVLERFGGLDVKDAFGWYPWNFSPFYAVSLFGGAYIANRFFAIVAPALAYAGLNLTLLWLTGKPSWVTEPEVWFNYALFMLFPLLGLGLARQDAPMLPAVARSFSAALLFFVLSNIPPFLTAYPRTVNGLIDCYTAALPFFQATLFSSVLFTAVLFSPVGLKLATQPAAK